MGGRVRRVDGNPLGWAETHRRFRGLRVPRWPTAFEPHRQGEPHRQAPLDDGLPHFNKAASVGNGNQRRFSKSARSVSPSDSAEPGNAPSGSDSASFAACSR